MDTKEWMTCQEIRALGVEILDFEECFLTGDLRELALKPYLENSEHLRLRRECCFWGYGHMVNAYFYGYDTCALAGLGYYLASGVASCADAERTNSMYQDRKLRGRVVAS